MRRNTKIKLLTILFLSLCFINGRVPLIPPVETSSSSQDYNLPDVPIQFAPFWSSSEADFYATGMVWDDADLNGYLDLFISNGNDMVLAPNSLYLNNRGIIPISANWYSSNHKFSGHSAVGDIDDNGFPEFIVSNYIGDAGFGDRDHINLYDNINGTLTVSPIWNSTDSMHSFSCALGDMDNDGDLDLAVATGDAYYATLEPDRIYLNENGMFTSTPVWTSAINTASLDVTWGDVDNDGDLDLAFATDGEGVNLFINNNGTIEATPSWQPSNMDPANTLIFTDINKDGWLDLVVAFNSQLGGGGKFSLYLNDGSGQLSNDPGWQSLTSGLGAAIAVYDYDNDNDMDLAAGRWWDEPRIYENLGDTFTSTPVWQGQLNTVVEELCWVDVDADGVEEFSETLSVDGLQKLFYLSKAPLYYIDSVVSDGLKLVNNQFCYDLVSGWISLSTAPSVSLEVFYRYSFKNDLAVSNWDTSNLIYGNSNQPYVKMFADPMDTDAPALIQFSDSSENATSWLWEFHDGSVSSLRNPAKYYTEGGLFDVKLTVTLPDGNHIRKYNEMIFLHADTLSMNNQFVEPGQVIEIPIIASNSVPISQIDLPLVLSGDLPLRLDSFTTNGCRTSYFESVSLKHYNPAGGQMTFKLIAGTQPDLEEGNGEVLKLYFHLDASAQFGQSTLVSFEAYNIYEPLFYSTFLNFEPVLKNALISWSDCCIGIRGNINGDEDDISDIGDLLYLVDYMFLNPPGPGPVCEEEADVDGSGLVDISDLLYLVDYMFNLPDAVAPVDCP